jgi:hypothetical protein
MKSHDREDVGSLIDCSAGTLPAVPRHIALGAAEGY